MPPPKPRFTRVFSIVLTAALLFSPVSLDESPTDEECVDAWATMATLARQEARRGLTSDRLASLNDLLPTFVACTQGDGVDRWGPLVSVYFASEDVERVMCLMGHESNGDPTARNSISGAAGLMQVMPFWASHYGVSYKALFEPALNLEIASWILGKQGWTAWSPYNRGLCR